MPRTKNRSNKKKDQGKTNQGTTQGTQTESNLITIDDVSNSSNQIEFELRKEKLLQQISDEITKLNERKDKITEEINNAKSIFNEINTEINDLKEAKDKAEAAERTAYENAEKIRKEAETEKLAIIKAAAEEGKELWKQHIDDINKQLKDIVDRETKLQEAQILLEKDKRNVEYDKEAVQEMKEDLNNLKDRYNAANPTKIAALERELNDERNNYTDLKKRYEEKLQQLREIQGYMETIKAEIEDSDNEKHIVSLNEIVSALQESRKKYENLKSLHDRYPDDEAIKKLEEKAQKVADLEQKNIDLNLRYEEIRKAFSSATNEINELEIVKQEVEATKTLNKHLLKELKSHKTALESRTGDNCPSLSKVDKETEEENFIKDISLRMERQKLKSLQEIVLHIKNYAGNEKQLYYTDSDIRAFLAGLAVSRLIILQGMSGTGKSSLPRIFAEAISGFNKLIPVESSWRDRNELLGYYNDFNKIFNAKSFTIELYRSSKERCQEIPTFIVLDEMNLARIEYYFSDFLAILQEPDNEKWLIELVSFDMRTLPMELPLSVKQKMKEKPSIYTIWEKFRKGGQGDSTVELSNEDKETLTIYLEEFGQLTGAKSLINGRKIRVTKNIWFVGTANRDESTFEISDKVYDRAQVISLDKKGVPENKYISSKPKYISVSDLEELFDRAKRSYKARSSEVQEKLDLLDNVLMEQFDVSFGNRIVSQTIDFVAVFVNAGGTVNEALDYQISTKILRKIITSDDEEALIILKEAVSDYPKTLHLINKRLKELEVHENS